MWKSFLNLNIFLNMKEKFNGLDSVTEVFSVKTHCKEGVYSGAGENVSL